MGEKPDKKAVEKAAKALFRRDVGPKAARWKDASVWVKNDYLDAAELVVKAYLKHAPVTFKFIDRLYKNPKDEYPREDGWGFG